MVAPVGVQAKRRIVLLNGDINVHEILTCVLVVTPYYVFLILTATFGSHPFLYVRGV